MKGGWMEVAWRTASTERAEQTESTGKAERTERPGARQFSRRDFVRTGAAAVAPVVFGCLPSPTEGAGNGGGNPRLSVRPHAPALPAEIGETPLGLAAGADGFLYVPASYDPDVPTPLLVALHGATRTSRDWTGLFSDSEARSFVILAVDSRGRTWDRVGGFFGPDVPFIDAALDFTYTRVNVDPDRTGLVGFSDGASYALSLGPCNGDIFPHLIAFSPGHSAPTDALVGTPRIWVSHGTEDRILQVGTTRGVIVPTLVQAGYDVTYVEFEGRHEYPPSIQTQALDWFEM
jgi:phospholipase/carboxylesterase